MLISSYCCERWPSISCERCQQDDHWVSGEAMALNNLDFDCSPCGIRHGRSTNSPHRRARPPRRIPFVSIRLRSITCCGELCRSVLGEHASWPEEIVMPICSYCGQVVDKTEREHVFPRCLYPPSKGKSQVQRLTVEACRKCNGSWSNDEAHFRNVLVLTGDTPNAPRRELWDGKIRRSFDQPDGAKRIADLLALMKPVDIDGVERQMIYPGEDEKVLRVVRKVIRGLAHHHGLLPFMLDDRVWAAASPPEISEQLLCEMHYHHREPDIAEYWYEEGDGTGFHSAWLLRFFEAPSFVGMIDP